ncbi:MAG: hypothetical protein LBD20_07645 [Spirochaetaceae bacterium]|jgi:hypothetical protein|nr:hypothetical protein [Spirochaetaceae bacterium]
MRHFLFEDKEYEMRFNYRRRKTERDGAAMLLRNLRRGVKSGGGGGGGVANGRRKVDMRRKCVAKMQYSNSIEAHRVQLEKYLTRDGVGRDGEAAELFGTNIEEYRANMVGKNFRIFLSPQDSNVDIKELTEKFVKHLELQTGYKLYWQGACHYNTAHPHGHILINGVDKNGREVTFPRDIVKTFMREAARDLCTAQLGDRTKRDIEIERERELLAPRYTKLDAQIKELCGGTFRVNLSLAGKDKARVIARLDALRKLKLCDYVDGGYKLSGKWEESLQANGRYNTFLKSRASLRYTPASGLKVYTGGFGQVSGRVAKVFRTDGDASDNHAVVLETLGGRAFFVPLFKKPEVFINNQKTPLAEGEYITLTTAKSQTGRLTPRIYKKDIAEMQRMVKAKGYAGRLAEEISAGVAPAAKLAKYPPPPQQHQSKGKRGKAL